MKAFQLQQEKHGLEEALKEASLVLPII